MSHLQEISIIILVKYFKKYIKRRLPTGEWRLFYGDELVGTFDSEDELEPARNQHWKEHGPLSDNEVLDAINTLKNNLYKESYENETIIGYHGSRGNKDFGMSNVNGIWFVNDINSDILNYYSTRDNQKTIIKAKLFLGRVLDLSMYNADIYQDETTIESFLIDCELDDKSINHYTNYFFYGGYSNTDYNEEGEPILATSVILNDLIKLYFIPNKKIDSILIMEGNDNLTICMLNSNYIEILPK
jgi:hypothetical protein